MISGDASSAGLALLLRIFLFSLYTPPHHRVSINDKLIRKFFLYAWNSIIDGNLQLSRIRWTQTANDEKKTALERVRAKQMLELTSAGSNSKLEEDIPEIVRMILD